MVTGCDSIGSNCGSSSSSINSSRHSRSGVKGDSEGDVPFQEKIRALPLRIRRSRE